MKTKPAVLFAATCAAALALSGCSGITEQLPKPDLNSTIEKLDQMAKDGVEIRIPSAAEIEQIAKDTVCPALRDEGTNQAFDAAVSRIRRELGLTHESADLIASTGAQLWCPDEYQAIEEK